jgi:solute:Na+ symporter, SSS family
VPFPLTIPTLAGAAFEALDWAVLGIYLIALIAIGIVVSRRKENSADFFLAGRSMPVWAVALSVLATATSAATFIGAPEEAYVGNLTYLSTNIGTALAVVIVAFLFIPAFYRHNVTTVYDLVGDRFGYHAKAAASWTFMVGRIFASGSRLFAAALPASLILFNNTEPANMYWAILALTVAGVLTAMGGGIRSVIWTDVMQVGVFLLAAGAALWVLLHKIPASPSHIIDVLAHTQAAGTSKLTVLRPGLNFDSSHVGFNISEPYTLLTAIFGFSLLNLAAYGTDHDLTQRMLTCRTPMKGGRSAFLALAINLPMVATFMAIGLLLYIFYQRADVMGVAVGTPPKESREVFLRFILTEMPAGVKGLMLSGLFAVGVGSLNSVLAAMSSTFVNDIYKRHRAGRSDRHYLLAGRLAVAGWGLVLGGFACWCVYWFGDKAGTLLAFVLSAMTFAYAGLLGVFLTALCTKRGNGATAIAALVVGFVVVGLLQPQVMNWLWARAGWTMYTPYSTITREGSKPPVIAFPWRLTFGTAAAFLTCFAGTPRSTLEGGHHA